MRIISRDVPGPIPAPNSLALTPAEIEYRLEHAKGIYEAYQRNGDCTTYAGWNEADVRRMWPELWTAWAQYQRASDRLHDHLLNTCLRLSLTSLEQPVR